MRIAFLFESSTGPQNPLEWVFEYWLGGLVESQNSVKVIATRYSRSRLTNVDSKVDWAEPMKTWGYWEFPKLAAALLPFNPEVIHLVIGRESKIWQLWPALTHLPGPSVPAFVSLATRVEWPAPWIGAARRLEPRYSGSLGIPALAEIAGQSELRPSNIFIPGPLQEHQNWQDSIESLITLIPRRRDWKFHMGWQWTDVPVSQRADLRQRWLAAVPSDLAVFMDDVSLANQAQRLTKCQTVILAMLNPGWACALFSQTAQQLGIYQLDHSQDWPEQLLRGLTLRAEAAAAPAQEGAINQLARLYHQARG